jgi:O-antigen/teichoic acid export membrane protein
MLGSFTGFIKDNIKTATLRRSSITFLGTVVNAFFGALFYIFIARILGPSDFGLITIALTVLTLTSDMGDLGTDTGVVNFVSRHIENEKEKAYKFLKLGLEIKIFVSIFAIVIGFLFSGFIAADIFLKPQLEFPIQIAFMGVGSLLLFSFIVHSLQALQRFWGWSLIQAGTNLLRLILILLLFYLGYKNVNTTMWIYIFIPFVGFLYGLKMLRVKFWSVKNEWSVSNEFFRYNKWVALIAIISAVTARMDTFISARLLSSSEVGIYSAANQMIKIVPQIVIALGTVIGPRMAQVATFKEYLRYFKKTQLLVIGLSLLGLMCVPFVLLLIPYIFGNEYVSSGPVFFVLLISMLIFLISVPVHMSVFYYFSFPKLFFMVSLFHFILVSILGWYIIGKYGVIGASFTVLAGQIFDFTIPLIYVLRKIRKGDKR